MDVFTNYLLQFGDLNQTQIELIKSKLYRRSLPKNAYFSEAGKVAREVAFIEEGVLRSCFFNNKGEEITQYFFEKNSFAVDMDSFQQHVFSAGYFQAVTDCELIVLNKEDFMELSVTVVNWDMIIHRITNKVLLEKLRKLRPIMAEEAQLRYQHFLQDFPNLVDQIPLVVIASFLGITPSSLSRIRRKK
jgi:CRP-like cAMP-binding protein